MSKEKNDEMPFYKYAMKNGEKKTD
jgi:hypothetical protein